MSGMSLDCSISLSKKLRSILGDNGRITLVANDLVGGKGVGKLILQSENLDGVQTSEMPDILKGETSIQLTPISITKEMPPTNASEGVGSIFSTIDSIPQAQPVVRDAIDRLAAVVPPNEFELHSAILTKEEIPTPVPFKELDMPEVKTFVTSLQELMVEVETAKYKSSGIDLDKITDPRERALAIEQKELSEAIDKNAYVVNDQAGVLSINDLGITLALNTPFDLSNISAKRIAGSSELKGLIRSGMVKFISPDQISEYTNIASFEAPTYEIFDDHADAEANMASADSDRFVGTVNSQRAGAQVISGTNMEINADNIDAPTEEETMIQSLTSSIGSTAPTQASRGVRTTSHRS